METVACHNTCCYRVSCSTTGNVVALSFLIFFSNFFSFMDIDGGMVMNWCCVRCGEFNGLLSKPRT